MDYEISIDKPTREGLIPKARKVAILFLAIYLTSVYIFASIPSRTIISEIFFIMFFASVFLVVYKSKNITIPIYFFWFYSFSVILLFGSIYSVDINYSLALVKTYVILIFLIYLVVIVLNSREIIEKVMFYFSISGIFYSIYCVSLYGVDGIINSLTTGIRLGYEVGAPNSYGYYGAISTVLLIYLFITRRKKIYLAFSLLPLIVVLTSYSKKAFIIFVFSTLLLLFFKYKKRTLKMILIIILFSLGIYFVLQIPELELLKTRIISLLNILQFDTNQSTESDQIRVKLMAEGIKLFFEAPIIGHGTGAFRFEIIKSLGYEMSSHNNFVELLVNHGLVGIFLFYSPIIYLLVKLLKIYSKTNDDLSILLFVLLLNNTFINGSSALTYLDKVSFILLGVSLAYCLIFKNVQKNSMKVNY